MATPESILKTIDEPYPITSDDVQKFREDGYIHLAGVLSDDVLEYYEPIISKVTQEHDPAGGVALEDKDLYGKAFIDGPLPRRSIEHRLNFTMAEALRFRIKKPVSRSGNELDKVI